MAERKSFLLRIDRDTLGAVQRWANDDLRSLNGQIEFLLRCAIQQAGRAPRGSHDAAHTVPAEHPLQALSESAAVRNSAHGSENSVENSVDNSTAHNTENCVANSTAKGTAESTEKGTKIRPDNSTPERPPFTADGDAGQV